MNVRKRAFWKRIAFIPRRSWIALMTSIFGWRWRRPVSIMWSKHLFDFFVKLIGKIATCKSGYNKLIINNDSSIAIWTFKSLFFITAYNSLLRRYTCGLVSLNLKYLFSLSQYCFNTNVTSFSDFCRYLNYHRCRNLTTPRSNQK